MFRKIIFLCLLAGWMFIFAGCKGKSGGTDANQVKEKVSQAVETTGSYLAEQKDAAIKKSQDAYESTEKETKDLIAKIKNSSVQDWQKMSSDLQAKMDTAQQKLSDFKEASLDKAKAAENAFDTAIKELKDAYQKTKTEYEKSQQVE